MNNDKLENAGNVCFFFTFLRTGFHWFSHGLVHQAFSFRFFYWLSTLLSHENLWRRTKRVGHCKLECNAATKWLKLCLFASFAKWCVDWLVLSCLEPVHILDCRITHFWMEILSLEIWILSSKSGRQGYGYHIGTIVRSFHPCCTVSDISDSILISRPWNEFQRLMMPCHLEAMSFLNTHIRSQCTQ